MERHQIVERVNQLLGNENYGYEDMMYDLDEAIYSINNVLSSTYPVMSEVLTYDHSKYYREIREVDELPTHISLEDKKFVYKMNDRLYYAIQLKHHHKRPMYSFKEISEKQLEIFPFMYINTVVIPFVVAALFKRLDEFGSAYQVFLGEYNNGLNLMFRNHQMQVPIEYQDLETGMVAIDPEVGGYL